MHGPINVKSPNNSSKWQMRFNSAFKGLTGFVASYSRHELWPELLRSHENRNVINLMFIVMTRIFIVSAFT
jgi:hypothetical protein